MAKLLERRKDMQITHILSLLPCAQFRMRTTLDNRVRISFEANKRLRTHEMQRRPDSASSCKSIGRCRYTHEDRLLFWYAEVEVPEFRSQFVIVCNYIREGLDQYAGDEDGWCPRVYITNQDNWNERDVTRIGVVALTALFPFKRPGRVMPKDRSHVRFQLTVSRTSPQVSAFHFSTSQQRRGLSISKKGIATYNACP